MTHQIEYYYKTDEGEVIPVSVSVPQSVIDRIGCHSNSFDLGIWLRKMIRNSSLKLTRGPTPIPDDCPRCEGTGVYNFGACAICNGTGKLDVAAENGTEGEK